MAAALHRQRLREAEEPGLGRRVARLAEPAERAGNGSHVHDPAPAALLHARPDRLRAVEGTGQIDAQVAFPELRRLVVDLRRVVERARVVDQDVDRAELRDGALDSGGDLLAIGDVAPHGQGAAAELADLGGRLLGVDEALRPRDRRERAVAVGGFREL